MDRTEAQLPLSKRLLAAFFSLVLVVGLVPTSAWAEGEDPQNGDNQEQIGGGDTGDNTSGQNDTEGTGEDPTTGGDEGTDENGIEEESTTGFGENGIQVASDNDPETVATIDYDTTIEYENKPTKKEIYNHLAEKFGNPDKNGFFLWYTNDTGQIEKKQIKSSDKGNFSPYKYGEFTYDVYWDDPWGKSYTGTLTVRETVNVTSPTNPDEYGTYDGTTTYKWEPTVTSGAGKIKSKNYDVTYYRGDDETNDFTSAGTIRVEVTGKDNYSYVKETRTYTIQKANVNVVVEGKSDTVTYNGTEQSVSGFQMLRCAAKDDDSKAAAKLYVKSNIGLADDVKAEAKGTNASDEKILMGLTDGSFVNKNDNYNVDFSLEQDGWLKIDKSDSKPTFTAEGYNRAYDGKDHSVTVTPDDLNGAKVLYSTDGETWSEEAPKVKNVVEAFDVFVKVQNDNYTKESDSSSCKLGVTQARVEVFCGGKTIETTYNGQEQSFLPSFEVLKVEDDGDEGAAALFDPDSVKLNAHGKAKVLNGMSAGTYTVTLSYADFETQDNNFKVNWTVQKPYKYAQLTIAPAKITVNVKGNTKTVTYNGDKQQVTGFTATTDSKIYNTGNVVLNGGFSDIASGTDADTYLMGLGPNSFYNADDNFDVTWNFEGDGALTIDPAEVNVSVKGNSDTVTYNGKEQQVTGFTATADSDLYNVGNVVPNEGVNTIAKGTAAGTYKMDLSKDSFYNADKNFNVTWSSVEDGILTIKAADVTVNVKGNTDTVTYNGEKQQVTGFTATTDSDLYDTSDVVLNEGFSDIASGTDAGNYTMGLAKDSFFNTNDNFNVTWNFQGDGGITIEKRAIQVSDSASVVYNGQEQALSIDASKVTGLVDGDRLNLFDAQVKGTEPGTYTDVTDYRWEVVNDELNVTKNYELAVNGELTITKADSANNGSSADNGTKASGSSNGSTTTKTADTALPFGVAFAAAAAALAALVATRKLRSMR